jgi:adenine-specific DNA-methyltransferase
MNRMLAREVHSLEMRRRAMQAEIDSRRSAAERNRLGQFATPNPLAVQIARYVAGVVGRSNTPIRFADPAVGSGSFFSAALAALDKERIDSAIGIELDPTFCEMARALWSSVGLEVMAGDFTRIVASRSRPASPNLILANPPYVRHHYLGRDDKERLRALAYQMTRVEVNGLAGLYVYFLLLATAWMDEGGYAAWLVPSEFMDVNYGAALKQYLTDRVTLIRIHRFDPDDVQFGDAFVSSVVLVFRKAAPPSGCAVDFTFGGTFDEPCAAELVELDQLRSAHKWTVYPSHAKNDRRTASDTQMPILGDLFRVQRGIATGCNKFFVLERAEAERRRLPRRFLRPILPSPRHLKVTVVDAGEDGYPLNDLQLCLIDCDLPEHLVETRHPTLWEYLQTARSHGILDRYLIGKRTPWYKQERREPAPFLCTYMGRGSNEKRPFRFIWNRSDAIGTNLYLMLYPKSALAAMLRDHPLRAGELHELLGEVGGHELRGEGRVYGGGLHKIEPTELARISAAGIVSRWPDLAADLRRHQSLPLFDGC